MSSNFIRTKPSFLEGGLPCASLSAECQRDNNARQRPPQNRLHIWWARRPPTICRAAILAALLPHDVTFLPGILPSLIEDPNEQDLLNLSGNQLKLRDFFLGLINEVTPSTLSEPHKGFLLSLGITGDTYRAYRRLVRAENADAGQTVTLGNIWGYRHPPAFSVTPSEELTRALHCKINELTRRPDFQRIRVLDFMAGGGAIPLEGVRYGFEVFANDLNPISSLVLKATIEYPAKYGTRVAEPMMAYAQAAQACVEERLKGFFPFEDIEELWPEIEGDAERKFKAATIQKREPAFGHDPIKNTYLWLRQMPCSKCQLNIPLSTNFHIVNKKGKPEAALAAFPEVPLPGQGNDCTFRIVKRKEWQDCHWPKPEFEGWHPRNTPTFKGGDAICPRCGDVVDGEEVKQFARSRPGGLPAQMYAVCSQVPVKLTYTNGEEKVRFLWRFRAPTGADLAAARAAEEELDRRLPAWEAAGLVPDEEIPEGDKTKEPRNMGVSSQKR